MHLPAVQAVERNMALVGSALRYCLRFLTPSTVFFLLLTIALDAGAVNWLPLPYSARVPFGRRYIAVDEASNLTAALGGVALLVCIVSAVATLDDDARKRMPSPWHLITGWIALLQHFYFVPAFEY